MTAMKFKSVF